jgi:hypothetical protein
VYDLPDFLLHKFFQYLVVGDPGQHKISPIIVVAPLHEVAIPDPWVFPRKVTGPGRPSADSSADRSPYESVLPVKGGSELIVLSTKGR